MTDETVPKPPTADPAGPTPLTIAGRAIGPGEPPYIVAEVSANHRQDFQQAVAIVRAAAEAGADAVKLQTYTADTLTLDCDRPEFRIRGTLWNGRTLHDLYGEASMPWEWQPKLRDVARGLGLTLFSTPFDATAVAFLESLAAPAYKIASFELVDLPLLRCVAATGKPVILSTGMATLEEIDEAVQTLRQAQAGPVALLKCTSAYPAGPDDMNLRGIPRLAEVFGLPVGLSDHTLSTTAAVAAVALGATIIEKHLTLSRASGGPDCEFSLEPAEFRQMAAAVRAAYQALGSAQFGAGPGELDSRRLRRSLFAVRDIRVGERFTPENVRSIRPADGLPPRYLDRVLRATARVDITRGTPLAWEHLA
jgi:N-acetylneuraminate synthase